MDDAVAHDDAQAKRTPIVFLKSVDDAIANVVVVGGRVGDLGGEAWPRLPPVGARHDANDPVSARHRQTLDTILFHQLHDRLEISIFGDGQWLRRHDLADLATVLVNEIGCLSAWAKNELQEPAALALGADFAAPNEVAFRDDADEFTGRVDARA